MLRLRQRHRALPTITLSRHGATHLQATRLCRGIYGGRDARFAGPDLCRSLDHSRRVDLPLLEMLAQRGPVALDVQGFVRVRDGDELVFRPWAEMARGLSLVTYLKVDRAEAELLTGETDLEAAAAAWRAMAHGRSC